VILSRFDLWPAALAAGGIAALAYSRLRLGHVLLGIGAAAKFYPAVLLPLAVAHAWKTRGRREALACLSLAVGVFALVFLPFVVVAPGGVWHSVSVQLGRPLQVESLGAAFLLVAHNVFGFGLAGETSHGFQNVAGGARMSSACLDRSCRPACSSGSGGRSRAGRRPRVARPLERGARLRVRRLREGALAAVPDLADPGRAARARPARALGERAAPRRARA
jgi:hypothetical protein